MSALFKVFTLEQRVVFEKHVLPKLWKRERVTLRRVNRESRVAMQTVLSAKDYQILAFSFKSFPKQRACFEGSWPTIPTSLNVV